MFDSSSLMQVDQPLASPSTATTSTNTGGNYENAARDAPVRDIAAGGIQRERRKRDKLKEWQVAVRKSPLSARLDDDSDEEEAIEADHTVNDSAGIVAQAQRLLVSRQERWSRSRAESTTPFAASKTIFEKEPTADPTCLA
jgi:hypothetical protein